MAAGWPPCLWVLAATVQLIKEGDKLNLGEELNVKVSHAVVFLMNTRALLPFQLLASTMRSAPLKKP